MAFDPERIMKELLDAVSACYEETGELKRTAEEIGLSALKVRKLLITARVYSNDISEEVSRLSAEGKSPEEIQLMTGLGRSSVNAYLPYAKVPYKMSEVSLNAERIRLYRERRSCVDRLQNSPSEEALWDTVVAFQGYTFHTAVKGFPFKYALKVGRDGGYNKELIIDRRKDSKTLAWSSLRLAFKSAVSMQEHPIRRPKDLGDIRGISYIYAMLIRWGIINPL